MRKFLLMLAFCTFLASCDLGNNTTDATSPTNNSTTSAATDTPSATTDTPTNTPQPGVTSTPTTTSGVPSAKACGANFPSNRIYGYIGDMLISQPFYGFLSYLGLRLPDNMPGGVPFKETAPTSTLPFTGVVQQNPAPVVLAAIPFPSNSGTSVLGDGPNGFALTICNSSTTKSHLLNALGIQIARFTPATASNLNIQLGCDSAISSKNLPTGGCGGSSGPLNTFHANWPAGAGVGTTNTLNQTGSAGASLPITLKPGQLYNFSVGTGIPAQSGTYTFTFGMQVDNGSLATVSAPSFPLFMGTGLHLWSGFACLGNAAWKKQVMASTSYFVCPD